MRPMEKNAGVTQEPTGKDEVGDGTAEAFEFVDRRAASWKRW